MAILEKLIQVFWETVRISDNKRLAAQQPSTGLKEVNNIPYGDSYTRLKLLDVYYPEGTSADDRLPIVIDVHGGGWYYGDKELNKNYCLAIAKRGYCVFNISYRLVPDVTMPIQLQDVMQALKWIKNNAAKFPCNPDKILLTGDSAGGQLALYAGALCKSKMLRNIFETVDPGFVPDCLGLTCPVAYLKPAGGYMGINALTVVGRDYKKRKYASYLDADNILQETEIPPVFLLTSSGDGVGLEPTIKLFRDIEKTGNKAVLMNWDKVDGEDLPHVFPVGYPLSKSGAEAIDKMLEFFMETESENDN